MHNFGLLWKYENDLPKIIYEKNFLNSRNIWKIFIHIIFGINDLYLNNILSKYLLPQNIFLDKENNIKIGGISMALNTTNKRKEK